MANRSEKPYTKPPPKASKKSKSQGTVVVPAEKKPASKTKAATQATATNRVSLKPSDKTRLSETRIPKSREPKASTSSVQKTSNRKTTKPLAYSDLDLKQWRDYEDVLTDSLWLFNQRERQGGHQLDYHGNCVPQIITQVVRRFTKPNDIVLDLFLGSGTSSIEALNLGRRAIGVELQPSIAEYVQEKLDEHSSELGIKNAAQVLCGDSSDAVKTGKAIDKALKRFDAPSADLLFLHPPYHDIIQFSEDSGCLSNADSNEAFLDQFQDVAQLGYDKLTPGRFAVVVIGDKYSDSEWIPLGFQCLERMNRVGFTTKSIIVKNITGNEKGKGRTTNLWRYRALAGGFYLFKHEYVLIFQKPK